MFRFLHTADIHLDSPLVGLETHDDAPVETLRGATRRAFDNLIELAIEEEVAFLVISGDLYDGDWKDYNTGLYFAGRMGRLAKAGIRVFIVSGNHDAASNTTKALPLPANVAIFSQKAPQSLKIEDLGVVIHGQSYPRKEITDNLAAAYPVQEVGYFNIGLLHTALTGRENHAKYAPCNLADLQSKGYDYWALGHVHTRELVSENPAIIFPGNIQGRNIRETGAKGATLVTVDEGIITAIQPCSLDVLRWAVSEVDLSNCQTTQSVYDLVRSEFEQQRDGADGRTVAVRLILTGRTRMHAQLLEGTSRWTEEFRAIAESLGDVWLEKVKFRTSREVSLDELVGEDTPLAGLIRSIQNLEFEDNDPILSIPELAALQSKLPLEIRTDEESFLDTSPERLAELSTEIQEMLIARLLHHGVKNET